MSKGGLKSTIVEIKHIIYVALKSNSSAIIVAHNYPSGNLKPSSSDIQVTNNIMEACRLMDLNLLDHIIIPVKIITV